MKQVLTILLSVLIFNLTLTAQNATGITLTLLGGAWYGYIEYNEKTRGIASSTNGGGLIPQWKHQHDVYDKHPHLIVTARGNIGNGYRQLMQFLRTSTRSQKESREGYSPSSDEEMNMSPPPPPYSHLNTNSNHNWTS